VPVTQGSMNGYVMRTKTGGMRARIVDQKETKLKPWREAVRSSAVDALAGRQPLEGPVVVRIVFGLARPTSAPKTRRTWPTGKRSGDLDKLARAVFDALTDAGVWLDDSQVVSAAIFKDFVGHGPASQMHAPGAQILVKPLNQEDPQ
jgi:crossover junction endodeoxyribonuclease RusA